MAVAGHKHKMKYLPWEQKRKRHTKFAEAVQHRNLTTLLDWWVSTLRRDMLILSVSFQTRAETRQKETTNIQRYSKPFKYSPKFTIHEGFRRIQKSQYRARNSSAVHQTEERPRKHSWESTQDSQESGHSSGTQQETRWSRLSKSRFAKKKTYKEANDIQARWLVARDMERHVRSVETKRRSKSGLSKKPQLDNARKLRGIYSIDPADKDFKQTKKCAQKVGCSDASSNAVQDQRKRA